MSGGSRMNEFETGNLSKGSFRLTDLSVHFIRGDNGRINYEGTSPSVISDRGRVGGFSV